VSAPGGLDRVEALAERWARPDELDASALRALTVETDALCDELAAEEELEGLVAMLELSLPRALRGHVARALAGFGEVVVAPLLALRNSRVASPELDEGSARVFDAMDQNALRRGLEGVLAQPALAFAHADALDLLGVSARDAGPGSVDEMAVAAGYAAAKTLLEWADERPKQTRPVNAEVAALLDRWYAAANDDRVDQFVRLRSETKALVERLAAAGDAAGLADLLELPGAEGAAPILESVTAALTSLGAAAVPALDAFIPESGGSPGGARATSIRARIERSIGLERMRRLRLEAEAEEEEQELAAREREAERRARGAERNEPAAGGSVAAADDLTSRWFAAADAEDAAALDRLRIETDDLITRLEETDDVVALVVLLDLPAIAVAKSLLRRLEDLFIARGEAVVGLLLLTAQRAGGGLASARALQIAAIIDPSIRPSG
jgi:hypothetical protein